ncbi:MAG: YbdK family carboxylate-amine ligase [Bacteriovoracaceae bacterium]
MEDLFSEKYEAEFGEKIGIEIEYQLLDEATLDLTDQVDLLLSEIGEDESVGPEVFQSCIEIKTPPVFNTGEAYRYFHEKLQTINYHAGALGIRLCSLGVHPFNQKISKTTNRERYLALEKEYPYITHNQLNFATHVHISMDSLEQTLSVMNGMRPLIPLFMAVSASCPFWKGEETGFASFRQYLLKHNFNGGIPPHLETPEQFRNYCRAALNAKAIHSLKDIHWDIKPRPDLGTLEVRMMDALPSLEEAMAISALAHCTVRALKRISLEKLIPDVFWSFLPRWAEEVNYFQAIHFGIDASFIISQEGKTLPLREMVNTLVSAIKPFALEVNELEDINNLERMLEEGLPYQKLTKLYFETGSLKEVVNSTTVDSQEFFSDIPLVGLSLLPSRDQDLTFRPNRP